MEKFREQFVKEYLKEIHTLLTVMETDLVKKMDDIASILLKARSERKTIFIMGNGGSASTASHFVSDLSKGTIVPGFPRFKAVALTDNIPTMLAWANDASYDDVFIEQLKNLMEPGDVIIGISGSGNSPNVVKAIEYANGTGGITIGISGYDGGALLRNAKVNVHAPSHYMQRVEDIHLLLEHLLTSLIREEQQRQKK
jgi:D-sedoheptulose 7-phosphate isomerase